MNVDDFYQFVNYATDQVDADEELADEADCVCTNCQETDDFSTAWVAGTGTCDHLEDDDAFSPSVMAKIPAALVAGAFLLA